MISTIYILWLRQIKRYFRSKARIFGSLGQPLLFLVALGFGLGPTFAKAGQGNYLEFITPGIISMSILFTALGTAIASVLSDMQGFQLIMNFLVMPFFFLSALMD